MEYCPGDYSGQSEAFNKAALNDLSRGQNSVNIVLDQAALAGHDPEVAPDMIGKGGLSLASLSDAKIAFKDIDLTLHPIRLDCGATGIAPFALLAAQVKEQGGDLAKLNGSLSVDPLGVLAVLGSLAPFPWQRSMTRWLS